MTHRVSTSEVIHSLLTDEDRSMTDVVCPVARPPRDTGNAPLYTALSRAFLPSFFSRLHNYAHILAQEQYNYPFFLLEYVRVLHIPHTLVFAN